MPEATAAPVVVPLGTAPPLPGTTDAPQMDTNGNWLPTMPTASSPPGYAATIGQAVDTIAKLGGIGSAAQVLAAGTTAVTGQGPAQAAGGAYDTTVESVSRWVWYAIFAVVALAALILALR